MLKDTHKKQQQNTHTHTHTTHHCPEDLLTLLINTSCLKVQNNSMNNFEYNKLTGEALHTLKVNKDL